LPGVTAGPGPLRRRAELFALRVELTATERARQEAMTTADAMRAAVQESERHALEASAALEAAQLDARRAAEHQGELDRRRQRAEREVHDADALADRLVARRDQLAEQLARLDDESQTVSESVAVRADASARA